MQAARQARGLGRGQVDYHEASPRRTPHLSATPDTRALSASGILLVQLAGEHFTWNGVASNCRWRGKRPPNHLHLQESYLGRTTCLEAVSCQRGPRMANLHTHSGPLETPWSAPQLLKFGVLESNLPGTACPRCSSRPPDRPKDNHAILIFSAQNHIRHVHCSTTAVKGESGTLSCAPSSMAQRRVGQLAIFKLHLARCLRPLRRLFGLGYS